MKKDTFNLGDRVVWTDQFKKLPSITGTIRAIDVEGNGLILYEIKPDAGKVKWEFIHGEAHELELID